MSEMCSVCIVRAQRDDDDFLPCSPACFRASLNAREQYARWDEREKAEIHNYHMPAYAAGFAAGLDAAREAVEAVPHWTDSGIGLPFAVVDEKWIAKDLALAVVDALKDKP